MLRKILELLAALFRAKPPGKPVPLPKPAPPRPVPKAPTPVPGSKAPAWLAVAITIVAAFEGLYTKAYKDPVGVTTICYGVTNHDRKVKMGDRYSKEECVQFLKEDLIKYKKMVDRCIKVDMPPHRTAALVSFTYNVGQGNLCKSSVARKLNAGDVKGGCNALLLYNKAGGKVFRGLERRRAAERELCLRND